MMVQVLEADERSVRLSSLQTGRRERPPQTPERDSLLALMVESALIDAPSLRDLQSTSTPLLKPLWKSPPRPLLRCGAQLDSCSQQYDS